MANLVKYFLFATNFLVFVMGCIVLGFGIFALVDGQALTDLVSIGAEAIGENVSITIYSSAAIILIVVSVCVIIISFFGCCGAIKENKCMLGSYFVIILALFVVMIVGAVLGYGQDLEKVKSPLKQSMHFFNERDDTANKTTEVVTASWNQLQKDFNCCGVDSFVDWKDYYQFFDGNATFKAEVPRSCCDDMKPSIPAEDVDDCVLHPSKYNETLVGCFTKFTESIDDNSTIILAVGASIVCIMFLNMLFAFALCTMSH